MWMKQQESSSPASARLSLEVETGAAEQAVGAVRGAALCHLQRDPVDCGQRGRPARLLNRAFCGR